MVDIVGLEHGAQVVQPHVPRIDGIARSNDDTQAGIARPGLTNQLDTAHASQTDIGKQHVEWMLLELLQRSLGRLAEADLVPQLVHDFSGEHAQRRVILDEQNPKA